ncbi:asparagine synthase-related protein [Micromonospora sp. NBC_00898]|uniref:asparagine synthase-related protein n=1 Tax=Micromonospora sp. NBC_00898 TaxID=2975981 RepID=UPI00386610C1|nr:asparagine synthase-related protein [Micromonospora sp. NBC_00898]
MDTVAAPFAAALVGDDLLVGADHLGLRHIYAVQGTGWAAISTSSMLLAQLGQASLDSSALGSYCITGQYLGLATPFEGVAKLAPGHRWRLADGRVTSHVDSVSTDPTTAHHWSPRAGAQLLRDLVEAHLARHPETVLELSGGMDSRLILAAAPHVRRGGITALTLSSPGSADVPLAREIASLNRLRHKVVDLSPLAELDPAEAHQRVLDSATRHDCSGNPVTLGVLDWAEQQVEPGVRLTGQAGEMIRGLYFLEPRSSQIKPAHVDRFARWWFTSNEAVPAACLVPHFAAQSRAALRAQLQASFGSYDLDWRSARDQFLLRERVHRWSGINYSDACLRRTIGSPYFDTRFLRMCQDLPAQAKSSSRFAARMLEVLDPELANMPLASGLRPVDFPRPLAEYTFSKVVTSITRKLVQRVRPVSRAPIGADALAEQVVKHWRAHPDVLAPAAISGVVREEWLAGLLTGAHTAGPATVGLLANLLAIGEAKVATGLSDAGVMGR